MIDSRKRQVALAMNQGDLVEARVRRRLDLSKIDTIMGGEFFSALKTTRISPEGWRLFVMEKYASAAPFLDFLQHGARLWLPHSHVIAQIFEDNYKDEVGYFAGTVREEYAHETWRLRSLKEFGIEKKHLAEHKPAAEVVRYGEIVKSLTETKSHFETVGAILFWEPFVTREMKALIEALERDLPDVFPDGGYDHTNFPHNPQEYWYSHAEHDVWHFKQIREGLQSYLNEHELSEQEFAEIRRGMDKVHEAKNALYSKALLERMRAAGRTETPKTPIRQRETAGAR